MDERKYDVLCGEEVIAKELDIDTATTLVGALMEKYYAMPELEYTIRRVPGEE